MLLEGKVAIVSGVGPGLGQANARALAREGASVVLAARNADYLAQVQAEIEAGGGRALAVPTNLVEPDQVASLVARTTDRNHRDRTEPEAGVGNVRLRAAGVPASEVRTVRLVTDGDDD